MAIHIAGDNNILAHNLGCLTKSLHEWEMHPDAQGPVFGYDTIQRLTYLQHLKQSIPKFLLVKYMHFYVMCILKGGQDVWFMIFL